MLAVTNAGGLIWLLSRTVARLEALTATQERGVLEMKEMRSTVNEALDEFREFRSQMERRVALVEARCMLTHNHEPLRSRRDEYAE
jgi:hypothetical protein